MNAADADMHAPLMCSVGIRMEEHPMATAKPVIAE
jgi:hypothetical protein